MIERKYKIDNGRIVRRADGVPIPEDEPLFILRAQDINALPALLAYHVLCKDLNHKASIVKSINAFKQFATENPDRMKEPDV